MVYHTASQKILIYLFIATLAITIVSGTNYWMFWSILPLSFFLLWLVGKSRYQYIKGIVETRSNHFSRV
jgi:cellulose synthase/poly-beta-1,6-N-acetylglucosamine synthase-like glycosyltransferase